MTPDLVALVATLILAPVQIGIASILTLRQLGPAWVARRMKALRLALIALPGRVIRHARRLIIRLASDAGLDLVLSARRNILALARGPT